MNLSNTQNQFAASYPMEGLLNSPQSGLAGMPLTERCVPEFEMQAATMDKQVEELHAFVEALSNKLQPVLRPPVPASANQIGQPPDSPIAPIAPIADYLRSKNRSIRQALDALSYLVHERIDL